MNEPAAIQRQRKLSTESDDIINSSTHQGNKDETVSVSSQLDRPALGVVDIADYPIFVLYPSRAPLKEKVLLRALASSLQGNLVREGPTKPSVWISGGQHARHTGADLIDAMLTVAETCRAVILCLTASLLGLWHRELCLVQP